MRTRIKVTKELEDYCPLTTGKIIGAWLLAVAPWLLLCISIAAFLLLEMGEAKNNDPLVLVSIMCFMVAAVIFLAPGRRGFIKDAKDRQNRNVDAYWMFYVVNSAGNQMKSIGPLTFSARNAILRERTNDDWLYFLVSLNGEDGMVFNGDKCPRKDEIQRELCWWRVRPVVLATYFSDLHKVRLALVDKDGAVSPPLSIFVAARFIRMAPIGSLGENGNNLHAAIGIMLDRLVIASQGEEKPRTPMVESG